MYIIAGGVIQVSPLGRFLASTSVWSSTFIELLLFLVMLAPFTYEGKEVPLMEWESDSAEDSYRHCKEHKHTWSPFYSSSARMAAQTGILNVTEVIMYDSWSWYVDEEGNNF